MASVWDSFKPSTYRPLSVNKAALAPQQDPNAWFNGTPQGIDSQTPTAAAPAASTADAAAAQTASKAQATGIANAAALAAPAVSSAIDPRQEGMGPLVSGAASGASLGTSVAPGYGTAIGAAIGAGLGMLKADQNIKLNAMNRKIAADTIQAQGLNKVADQMKQEVNFKFGTQRGSFSSKTKGFQ